MDAKQRLQSFFTRFAMGGDRIDSATFSRLMDEIGYERPWFIPNALADAAAYRSFRSLMDADNNGSVTFFEFYQFLQDRVPTDWKNDANEIDLELIREKTAPLMKILAGSGASVTYESVYNYFVNRFKGDSFHKSKSEILSRLIMYAFDSNRDGALTSTELNQVLFGSVPTAPSVEIPEKKGWVLPTLVFGGITLSLVGIVRKWGMK